MLRSRAPSNQPGTFFVAQFSAGYITNMAGFDLRQAQPLQDSSLPSPGFKFSVHTRIREEADEDANLIVGAGFDESLEDIVRVSVVATGIDNLGPARQTQLTESSLMELAGRLRNDSRRTADERNAPPPRARPGAGVYDARSSFSFASMKSTSFGLVPGPPAKWPQIEGTGTRLAFGICATSNSLSSGGKYRSVWPGMT
jgi:FtsZ family, C-terminal domain